MITSQLIESKGYAEDEFRVEYEFYVKFDTRIQVGTSPPTATQACPPTFDGCANPEHCVQVLPHESWTWLLGDGDDSVLGRYAPCETAVHS